MFKRQSSIPTFTQDDKFLQKQSELVQGEKGARRNALASEMLVSSFYDDVTTIYEGFLRGKRISGSEPFVGKIDPETSDYKWITYNEVHVRATNLGSGLICKGCKPSQNTFIGIYSQNCVEWILTDFGCQMYSMISVPIYDTHGPEACAYIINHADVQAVICQATKVPFLLQNAKKCPQLKTIVKIGQVTDEETKEAKSVGVEIISFTDLEKLGENNFKERNPAKPDDTYTICYTSGTTGTPKGAIITHAGLISVYSAVLFQYESAGLRLSTSDVYLSYLPMAHIYERVATVFLFASGGRIGFYRGDPKILIEDIQKLRPTIFAAVPRILNRVYDKVMGQISESKFKSWLFERALKSKESDLKRNIFRGDTLWDKIVFKKIQGLFGGRLRLVTCGSAPLSAKVMMFFKCSLGECFIVEGYGQTECSAVCSLQSPLDLSAGHVGPPAACCMVKLEDVPEKNYYARDGKGEICIKGPNVFKGYLKDPEKTAEAIDEFGWLHTGDVGEFLKNGTFRIIDRSKHIFKLSQGEYVAPEKIELVCIRSPYVEQIFVHGDGLKSYIVGIVVPDDEALKHLAHRLHIEGNRNFLCRNEQIRKAIFDDIVQKTKEGQLASFEKPKAIYLDPSPFSVDNGLLTPTLKAKRPSLLNYYRDQINELYAHADQELKLHRSASEMSFKLEIDSAKLNGNNGNMK